MGAINLIHEESWRAARLIVSQCREEVDDEEIVALFNAVQEIVTDAMQQLLERLDRELKRLNKCTVSIADPGEA